ncbi:Myelin expression factor 2 [Pteropus alecto]|uniref:Myelin expression factor 2 n=1 Tax=Pteropus alecto TaxID=9402 RepID=L5K4Q7_PTEAL|nr:Myelin expression factor 2 [Pteropus alecto]
MAALTRHPIPPLPPPNAPTPNPGLTPSPSRRAPTGSREIRATALGAFSNRDPLPLPRPPPLSRSEPLSAGGRRGGSGGGMADADKPEVPGAAGDDSPNQQPAELPGEPRREPHPPETERQPPQHSSSSNGVKMENDESVKEEKSEFKEKSTGNKKANRFHPYSKDKNSGTGEKKGPNRNRVFISNIPYDMKWQAIKDLMREKVGEVTYVELFKDAEGKSRDPDGENARRALQRTGGSFPGGHVPDLGSGLMNLPPSILNNPNIPPEVISNLQAGRLGSTIFVANLDFKVGWKKLKEVFSIAGTVKRADIKEDKDGKSRGMGTVTFEQAIEAVQAICILIDTLALLNKIEEA